MLATCRLVVLYCTNKISVFRNGCESMQPNQATTYRMAVNAADEHGGLSGTDYEVGDLQGMLEIAIGLLSDDALSKLAVEYAEINEYFDLEEWKQEVNIESPGD